MLEQEADGIHGVGLSVGGMGVVPTLDQFIGLAKKRSKPLHPPVRMPPFVPLPKEIVQQALERQHDNNGPLDNWREEPNQEMEHVKNNDELKSMYPGIASCQHSPNGTLVRYNNFCPLWGIKEINSRVPHQNGTKALLLYNRFNKSRIVCGKTIQPSSALLVSFPTTNENIQRDDAPILECLSKASPHFSHAMDTRLFPVTPSAQTSEHLPPIEIMRMTKSPFHEHRLKPFPDCDIPCHYDTLEMRGVPRINIAGTDWVMIHSMEGPQYYTGLAFDPESHKKNFFYATTSFQSEVPLPYFSFAEYPIQGLPEQAPINYTQAVHGAVFLAQNCNSRNGREKIVEQLIQSPYIRVDSVSKCLHNAELPNGQSGRTMDKADILRQYLFYLAFENQNENDYITEKLWGSLSDGALPVYYGSPNIHQHVPPHSIIHVKDFKTTQDLAVYLGKVASNRTLYASYHTWRRKPLPPSFLDKYQFTKTHSKCRTCRWAFSKMYGLPWHHTSQTIQEPKISRTLCYQSKQLPLLVAPFQESWYALKTQESLVDPQPPQPTIENKNLQQVCDDPTSEALFTTKRRIGLLGGKLRRTVVGRDGIFDVFVEPVHPDAPALLSIEDQIVFQLDTPLVMGGSNGTTSDTSSGHDGASLIKKEPHMYWLQDETSRITILTSRTGVIIVASTRPHDSQRHAVLQIVIPEPWIPLHMRFVTEDVNTFYETGRDEAQYFASTMVEEWRNPIERHVVPLQDGVSDATFKEVVIKQGHSSEHTESKKKAKMPGASSLDDHLPPLLGNKKIKRR